MEAKEKNYTGSVANGFAMLVIELFLIVIGILSFGLVSTSPALGIITGILIILAAVIMLAGFFSQEPNEARVMVFFGKYSGTFKETGFYWVNPFMSKKRISFRARNLDAVPIKVNDKTGNPILIGLVLVWRVKDTYKAMFEIDSETIATAESGGKDSVANRMNAFENFVKVQSDAALRQVAGQYAYDTDEQHTSKMTLRSAGDEINEQLELQLNERLSMAGIEIVEARINYLAYAPEIAAVMLRRQQAAAIISAREKIVEGAVTMVKLALDKLAEDEIVELDEEKKAAMVSNLLVVLCSDESATPVVNTGTLNH